MDDSPCTPNVIPNFPNIDRKTSITPQQEREQSCFELIQVLHPPGATFEVRALAVSGRRGRTASGYFNNVKKAVEAIFELDDQSPQGIYVTFNPVNDILLARADNRIEDWARSTTTDDDVLRRRWMLVDLDPKRPAGISATDAERHQVASVAEAICEWLMTEYQFGEPIHMDSGNGRYLIWPVELSNNDADKKLIFDVLRVVSQQFSTEHVQVDTNVVNASRLVRVSGTTNRKGDNTADRPHRVASTLSIPDYLAGGWAEPVSRQKLEAVAQQLAPGSHPPSHVIHESSVSLNFETRTATEVIERARRYLDAIPPSVSGEGGHRTALLAAEHLVRGFSLIDADALNLFRVWNLKCQPSWSESELAYKVSQARHVGTAVSWGQHLGAGGETHNQPLIVTEIKASDIPPDESILPFPSDLAPSAFHGLVGEFVEFVLPETEASPAALLIHVLAYFAAMAGRERYYEIGGTHHHPRLFAVVVGETSSGRKGTANDMVREIFRRMELVRPAEDSFIAANLLKGLVSGEGVIHHLRDATSENDAGVSDKRLLIVETEFGSALRAMGREGNTLSPVLRDAWDGIDLRTAAKGEPRRATAPHVNLLGHITADELRLRMAADDVTNGLANRILWAATRRSKCLPLGGNVCWSRLLSLLQNLAAAVSYAREPGRMLLSAPAQDLWIPAYSELTQPRYGLIGKACERAAPQVLRLAMIYALMDRQDSVGADHLQAALEVWRYCESSATWAFGELAGDRVANEIERALRYISPRSATLTALHGLFNRNRDASVIRAAIQRLLNAGRIVELPTAPRSYRIA